SRHIAILAVGVGSAGLGVELAGLAGNPLRHDFGVLVDQDAHDFAPFTAATAFCPASPMLAPEMIGRPESATIFLPRSSLVPFMRTTSGTCSETAFDAVITPSAITSQRMMPPKMLTRMAFRPGFFS